MSRRDKLKARMLASPGKIRFAEVKALLLYEGFVLFNSRGSHRTFHRADGRVLTVVEPHGKRKTCHPDDVRRILEALER
ncbi:MAG: type II toxin-antitoxin system HicA family toxin [Isosphaeraceae bacterium]